MEPARVIDEVCLVLREAGRALRALELVPLLAARGVAVERRELEEILFAPTNARPGLTADRAFRWTFGVPSGAGPEGRRARAGSTTRGGPPPAPAADPTFLPPPLDEPLVRRPNPMSAVDARIAQTFAQLSDASRELRQTRMRVERVEGMLEAVTRELGQLKIFVARERENAGRTGGDDADGINLPAQLYDLTYREARRRAINEFELAYARTLVERHGGNVTRAADAAEVHRNVLHRILSREREDGAEADEGDSAGDGEDDGT